MAKKRVIGPDEYEISVSDLVMTISCKCGVWKNLQAGTEYTIVLCKCNKTKPYLRLEYDSERGVLKINDEDEDWKGELYKYKSELDELRALLRAALQKKEIRPLFIGDLEKLTNADSKVWGI